MKISIITPTYNSGIYIKDCISSVNKQTYKDVEHIIIDGGSTDDTLRNIRSVPNRVTKLISEPDNGIYDAMNKGIELSSGQIIGVLNSDDFYPSNYILELIHNVFLQRKCDAAFGNLVFVDPDDTDRIVRYWFSSPYREGSFKKGWHPPHPTLFVKKNVFDKFGGFNISLNVSADFELMLRLIEKHKIATYHINEVIVKMRFGGESTRNIKNIILGNKNVIKAFKMNNIRIPITYPMMRLLPKIKQIKFL